MAGTADEKRARLKAQKDKINKKLKEIESREKAAERKLRNRRLIVIGATLEKIGKERPALTVKEALGLAEGEWSKQNNKTAPIPPKKAEQKPQMPASPAQQPEAPRCQCGVTMVRGNWQKNDLPVTGWKCPSVFGSDGAKQLGHDLKPDPPKPIQDDEYANLV